MLLENTPKPSKDRRVPLFALICLIAVCLVGTVFAAEDTPQENSPEYKVISVADANINPSFLKIILRPLSAQNLEFELSAWLELLQSKSTQLSRVELALADPEKKSEIESNHKKVIQLGNEKSALIERVNQVVAVASSKGLDTGAADLYVRSVGGLPSGGGMSTARVVAKNWLSSPQGGLNFAKSIGLFLLCMALASLAGKVGSSALGKALDKTGQTSDLLSSFFVHTIRRVALVVGVVIGLSYLGVNIGPMIAAIGGAGFVIGFALKDSLGNFAAGLMILFYRPFDVGHFIKTAGVSGTVESLSLVATILKTPDNQQVIIPNGKIWNDVITNMSTKGTRRVDLVFGVGYDDNLNEAQAILEQILEKHELVMKNPKSVVKVNELADSTINFIVRPWVKTSDYWDVHWDVTRQVKEAFDEAGISIPYPQQDVHLLKS